MDKLSKEERENVQNYHNRILTCLEHRSSSVSKQINTQIGKPPLKLFPKTIHNNNQNMPLDTSKSYTSIEDTLDSKEKHKHRTEHQFTCGTLENISSLLNILANHVLECSCLEKALKDAHLIN